MSITSKFPGRCNVCGQRIPAGTTVEWDKQSKTIAHLSCARDSGSNNKKRIGTSASTRTRKCSTTADSFRDRETHKPGEQVTPELIAERRATLPLPAGVALTDEQPSEHKTEAQPQLGTVRKTKKGFVFVLAIGAYDKYYHSADMCEDMDCFCGEYGWKEVYRFYGVPCTEPDTEREKREAAENAKATAKAAQQAVDEQFKAVYEDSNLVRLTGVPSSAVTELLNAGRINEAVADTVRALVEALANKTEIVREGNSRVLYSTTLNGVTVYVGDYYSYDDYSYDDYRHYVFVPREIAAAVHEVSKQQLGTTPEYAQEWLEKYRGCEGTEYFEYVAGKKGN